MSQTPVGGRGLACWYACNADTFMPLYFRQTNIMLHCNAANFQTAINTCVFKMLSCNAYLHLFPDLPRGPIKNNSMRKLAAKTLMEILPSDIGSEIQRKLDEQNSSHDFVTLIGLVSFHGREQQVEAH